MKRDPHDIRKADIEDAAIDGEQVPRISVMPSYLCPACDAPLFQTFNWENREWASQESHVVYCRSSQCKSDAAKSGASGRTFDEAVARLREKVGAK